MSDTLSRLASLGVDIGSIIDVGVNESTPSLMKAFPRHKHVLIEPISDYFEAIRRNYAGFDYELLEMAAHDTDGVVHVKSESKLGDGKVSHSRIVAGPGPDTREIPCRRLDSVLRGKGLRKPYLLKIDVEGEDIPSAILRGARETLQDCACVVIEMTAPKFMERATLIDQAGFQLFDLFDLCYYGDVFWQVDAVFVKRSLVAQTPALRPMSVPPFDIQRWRPMRPHVPLAQRIRSGVARRLLKR